MKSKFKYFYTPGSERERQIFDSCIFILDTNVLLDLLRLGKELTDKAIATITANKARIKIPYYVGLEYHKHFREVVLTQCDRLKKAKAKVSQQTITDTIFNLMNDVRFSETTRHELASAFNQPSEALINRISELYDYYYSISSGTTLQDSVGEALDGLVFDELTDEQIRQYEVKGKARYDNKVPPGYKDASKRDNKFGDYIIWEEILSFARQNPCDICFVSRDLKEDWQEIKDGKRLCPRYELQREFQLVAPDNYFRTISLDRLLEILDKANYTESELNDVKELFSNTDPQKIQVDVESDEDIMSPEIPVTPKDSDEKYKYTNFTQSEVIQEE